MIVNAANGKKEEKRTYLLCMLRRIFPWSGEDNEASFDAYWTTVGVGCVIVVSVRGWKLLDEVGCWGRHWTWWPSSMVVGAGCKVVIVSARGEGALETHRWFCYRHHRRQGCAKAGRCCRQCSPRGTGWCLPSLAN